MEIVRSSNAGFEDVLPEIAAMASHGYCRGCAMTLLAIAPQHDSKPSNNSFTEVRTLCTMDTMDTRHETPLTMSEAPALRARLDTVRKERAEATIIKPSQTSSDASGGLD